MPEGPELALAGRYINEACGGLVFSGEAERSAVGRGPEVPFRSEAYRLGAAARGKELRLRLEPLGAGSPQALVFRFGMSGGFRLRPAASPPRHAHLRFITRESPPRALCFVDARRFGSWRLGDAWQPGRGPCVLSEYQAFRWGGRGCGEGVGWCPCPSRAASGHLEVLPWLCSACRFHTRRGSGREPFSWLLPVPSGSSQGSACCLSPQL